MKEIAVRLTQLNEAVNERVCLLLCLVDVEEIPEIGAKATKSPSHSSAKKVCTCIYMYL